MPLPLAHLSIEAFSGTTPAAGWKCPPGRAQKTAPAHRNKHWFTRHACQFTSLDRLLWRLQRPSAGQLQQ